MALGVEQDGRRRITAQEQGFGQAFGIGRGRTGAAPGGLQLVPDQPGEPGGQIRGQAGRRGLAPVNAPFLVHDLEQVGLGPQALGRAEKKQPTRAQGMGEDRDDLGLDLGDEIDEKIAADHEIHAQKGRIAHQIMAGENDVFAQPRQHGATGGFAPKKGLQPFRADFTGHAGAEHALAGRVQGHGIDVRGKDLERAAGRDRAQLLGGEDGHGIGLFAGGTAGHPHPDILVGAVAQQVWKHSGQGFEGRRVPEKGRHPDQQVVEQPGAFLGIVFEQVDIGGRVEDAR